MKENEISPLDTRDKIRLSKRVNILSLFATVVLAAETILSPLADDSQFMKSPPRDTARITFGTLIETSHVLGIATDDPILVPTAVETLTPTPTSAPIDLPPSRAARKSAYTIAIIGDSMVDTLSSNLGEFRDALVAIYPKIEFTLLNYGVGGTNIDYGLERLTRGYEYLGRSVPSLVSQKPDVVVIESFGYNPYPFEEGAINKHWLAMATMVDTVKRELPDAKIVMAATIAPNWDRFGDGAPFINMSADGKRGKVKTINSYIESTIKFAASQRLPLADAYTPSRDSAGNGKLIYINGGDHIHPSDEGRQLFGQILARTIATNHLLE